MHEPPLTVHRAGLPPSSMPLDPALVIRAYREQLRILEVPVRVIEKRPPSINLFKRVPNVLKNIGKLTWAIRLRG